MSWLDTTQIALLLGACWACYNAGKIKGVTELVELLLEKKLVTKEQIERL